MLGPPDGVKSEVAWTVMVPVPEGLVRARNRTGKAAVKAEKATPLFRSVMLAGTVT